MAPQELRPIIKFSLSSVHLLQLSLSALIDISESDAMLSDATADSVSNMSYDQLFDRYQRVKIRHDKNRGRLEKVLKLIYNF